MSLRSLLSQTCTIKRAAITVGSTGLPAVSYSDSSAGVPCLLQGKSGRTVNTANGLDITFDAILFVLPEVDVRPQQGAGDHPDQVVISGATYTVQAVVDRSGKANHKTCYLKGLRAPAAA